MAITFPSAIPTVGWLTGIEFTSRNVVGVNTAPGSLAAQVYDWGGDRWEANLTLAPMYRADGESWVAWLMSLRGQIGSCLLGDPIGTVPRGAASATPGTPQADGDQTARGRTLAIKTGLSTTANYLRAGDWLQVGSGSTARLHKNLSDASLDASGKVILEIWPALRAAVANNAAVVVASAVGKFQLNTAALSYQIVPGALIEGGTIPFIEDLRP